MSQAARVLSMIVFVAALALGAWHVWRFAEHTAASLAQRGPLDGQEGTLLHEARLILRGEPLYQPLQLDRVVGAPYPPLHAYTLAGVEYFARGDAPPQREQPLFRAGRLISLGAMLAAAALLGLTAWQSSGRPLVGLLAATLLLAAPPVQLWATRIKPDPLALALTAAGLLCATRFFTRQEASKLHGGAPRLLLLVGAALLFAAAFFTKQTYIAAALAVGLTLLFSATGEVTGQRWLRRLVDAHRPLLVFGLTYALAVGLVWFLLDITSAGQYSFHVWGLHPPAWWTFTRFLRYLGLLLSAWPLLALCLIGLPLTAWAVQALRRRPSPTWLLPLLYAGLGTATLIGAGTLGSHHNHLLEPTLALTLGGCAVAGRLLAAAEHQGDKRGSTRPLHAAGALLAAGLLLAQGVSYVQRPAWYGGEFDPARDDWQRFVTLIASQPGEVLSDDVSLLLLAGKEPRYDDPATMGPAANSGLWDQRGLLREVEERRFDLILLHFDATEYAIDPYRRWSPEFIAALRANYRLLYRDVTFSYVPRER